MNSLKPLVKIKVLFVCLGNICRSPSAQAVFEAQVRAAGLEHAIEVDSCGTAGYHINEAPDVRSVQAAKKRGYAMAHLRGRQLSSEDFQTFDYILAMDKENLANIQALAAVQKSTSTQSHTALFLEFNSSASILEVSDPYYGGAQGFENVLDLIEAAGAGLLGHIKNKHF